jgi:hypothetical protein
MRRPAQRPPSPATSPAGGPGHLLRGPQRTTNRASAGCAHADPPPDIVPDRTQDRINAAVCCENAMPRTRGKPRPPDHRPAVERPLDSPVADGRRRPTPHVWQRSKRVAVRASFTGGFQNLEPAAGDKLQPTPTAARSPCRRPLPEADPASARSGRPSQRIRAGCLEAQVKTGGRVLEPRTVITSRCQGRDPAPRQTGQLAKLPDQGRSQPGSGSPRTGGS